MEQINPYEIVKKIISKEGFATDYFSVVFEKNPVDISISEFDNIIKISFKDSKPKIKVNKYIRLTLYVSSVFLDQNGGTICIDSFPDIPFKYDWIFK